MKKKEYNVCPDAPRLQQQRLSRCAYNNACHCMKTRLVHVLRTCLSLLVFFSSYFLRVLFHGAVAAVPSPANMPDAALFREGFENLVLTARLDGRCAGVNCYVSKSRPVFFAPCENHCFIRTL